MEDLVLFLKDLGFSRREADIYATLLVNGPSTVTDLSLQIDVNRITLHTHVKELTQKGLLHAERQGKKRLISAAPLHVLEDIISDEKNKLRSLEKQTTDILPEMKKMAMTALPSSTFNLKRYHGRKSVKLVFEEVLKAKELRAFVSDDLDYYFPDNAALFAETHHKRNDFFVWEIMDKTPINEQYAHSMNPERYWYKLLPGKLEIIDYLIYDGKIAYVDAESKEVESVMAFVIDNDNIYNNARLLFDFMWNAPDAST
jgi:predicted transcriptional regulator